MPALDLRFRVPSAGLLALPWREPLAEWDVTRVDFRDIPVGPSRHLVRFVHADGRLWALKDLPRRVADKEYAVLRELEIMVENLTGGLLDLAARRQELPGAYQQIFAEAQGVADRYAGLWELLTDEPVLGLDDQHQIQARLRGLNDLGFAIDEVRLEGAGGGGDLIRLKTGIGGRTFHTEQLKALTGLDVGEGKATILLDDLRAHHRRLAHEVGHDVAERVAARHWLDNAFTPGAERAFAALGHHGDLVQAYCDLLEVRWLLSEVAGRNVGDEPALAALAQRATPGGAASLAFVDLATEEIPKLPDGLIEGPIEATPDIDLRDVPSD